MELYAVIEEGIILHSVGNIDDSDSSPCGDKKFFGRMDCYTSSSSRANRSALLLSGRRKLPNSRCIGNYSEHSFDFSASMFVVFVVM